MAIWGKKGSLSYRDNMKSNSPLPSQTADKASKSNLVGIFLMIVAMLLLPGLDACAKWLGMRMPASEISAARFSMQMMLLLPAMAIMGLRLRLSSFSKYEAARGICLALATWLFFISLKTLPMAEAISIFFVEPMILTLLGALLLKETIHIRRISAIFVGFIGALIVIQPSFEIFGWPALLPLGAAFTFAVYMIITRIVAQAKHPIEAQFSMSFFALLTVLGLAILNQFLGFESMIWRLPNLAEFSVIILLGLIATSGHLMIVFALRYADAGLLAPFQYAEILNAAFLGYLIFGDIPKNTTFLGASLIIGSGLYLIHRERLANRRAAQTG